MKNIRDQILSHALRLFARYGYQGLAMREIAQAVGVSKAALYYHFKDKEELFLAMLAGYLAEVGAAIDAIQARETSSLGCIQALADYFLSQPAGQRAIVRLASQEVANLSLASRQMFEQSYEEKLIGKIAAMFQAGMKAGEIKKLDPRVATWSLLGILYPYYQPNPSGRLLPAGETLHQVMTIYLDGIRAFRQDP